jgi:ribosomal protein S18 acetylase RimI-like enzyme
MPAPRLASDQDAPALARVINLAYRVEDFFVDGDRTDEADVRRRMAKPNAAFLVLDGAEAGELAAAVFVEIRHGRGYFGMLSVDPSQQQHGLGRKLIAAVEDRCREAGCTFLDIEVVNLREELPAFYRRFGFTPIGETPFTDPAKLRRPAHLVVMTKPL